MLPNQVAELGPSGDVEVEVAEVLLYLDSILSHFLEQLLAEFSVGILRICET